MILFSLAGWLLLFLILRTQTLHPFNPEDFHSGTWDLVVQHRLVVRDQHELAVLRRRDDALLLQPDGRADRPELRLGGDRHRGGHRADPRHHRPPQRDADARQLLAGPRTRDLLRAAADLDRRRACCSSRRASCRRSAARSPASARGPVASQEAIKELGTNGGGFFNVNSAYPFENPTGLSNLIEMLPHPLHPRLADLHLRAHGRQPPPGLGDLRGDVGALHRQRRRRLHRRAARHAGPARRRRPHRRDRRLDRRQPGGQGRSASASPNSTLWAAVTTVTSCGAVNAAFESLTGIGGARPDGRPRLRRVGLRRRRHRPLHDAALRPAGRLHRRPDGRAHARVPRQEDRGARDQARRRSGCSSRRWPCCSPPALALATKYGKPSIFASGPQGFSESLYAYMSQANNNGSAFAGYTGYYQPNARATSAPTASPSPTCSAA